MSRRVECLRCKGEMKYLKEYKFESQDRNRGLLGAMFDVEEHLSFHLCVPELQAYGVLLLREHHSAGLVQTNSHRLLPASRGAAVFAELASGAGSDQRTFRAHYVSGRGGRVFIYAARLLRVTAGRAWRS